jgi:hypothetical protein
MAYYELTQRTLQSQRSPYGKVLRESPDLLRSVIMNEKAKVQFFALDKRIIRHLAKNPNKIKEFTEALRSGVKAKFDHVLGKLGEAVSIKNVLKAQADRIARGYSYALEQIKDLPSASRKLFRGSKETAAKKWAQLVEAFKAEKGFKIDAGTLNKLVELKNPQKIRNLLVRSGLPLEKVETKLLQEGIEKIIKAEDAIEIQEVVQRLAGKSNIKVLFSPQASRLVRYLRYGARGLAGAGVLLGAGFAGYSFYQAYETDIRGKRNLLLARGGVWGGMAAADASLLAGEITGAVGGATSLAVTAALLPPVYMTEGAIESALEGYKTIDEWKATDETLLVHEWISTGGMSAGEMYRRAAWATSPLLRILLPEQSKAITKEHQETREKIAKAILMKEEVDEKVIEDRLHYLKEMHNYSPPKIYQQAVKILAESRHYASIMQERRRAKAVSAPDLIIGNINLLNKRFDKPGKQEIEEMLLNFQQEKLANIDPKHRKNFDKLSTGALMDLLYQMKIHSETSEVILTSYQSQFLDDLENYLIVERKINLIFEYIKRENMTPRPAKEIIALSEKFERDIDKVDFESRFEGISDSPEAYALYKLATFHGYVGRQSTSELKEFFREDNKNATGVYWDGEFWYLNEAGWNLDDKIGRVMDEAAMQKLIEYLEYEPDDIYGHRQDAMVDAYPVIDFSNQAEKAAQILRNAITEYPKIKKQEKPPAPKKQPVAAKKPSKEGRIEKASIAG